MTEALEIERVWLLRGLPILPAGFTTWQIDQGYLTAIDGSPEGRVRRTTLADGSREYHFNLKTGTGLVRHEREEQIDADSFAVAWQRTEGRRVRKLRHRVTEGDLTFEIDQFLDLPLVLAEVELARPDSHVVLPPWLAPYVVREVTHENGYRNFNLAVHGTPAQRGG